MTHLKVKEDIVEYAKYKWPLLFSRFYEALRVSGPILPKNDVIIAINWTGIYMVDDQEQVLLELSFPEITAALSQKSNRPFMQNFSLATVRGEEFTFQSPNSLDICELVSFFLNGLKNRSKFVIALQDYKGDGPTVLSFNQGDLMILDEGHNGESVFKNGWVSAKLEKTGERGDVPTECIYVLPTTTKPPATILSVFSQDNLDDGSRHLFNYSQVNGFDAHEKPHTLEEYAMDHFRTPPKYTLPRTLTFSSARKRNVDQLWRHSREPIKQPLLKKLLNKEDLIQESCFAFNYILFILILFILKFILLLIFIIITSY